MPTRLGGNGASNGASGAARPRRGWTPRHEGLEGSTAKAGQGLHGGDKRLKADGVNWGTAGNSSLCRVVSPRGSPLPTPPPACSLWELSGRPPTLWALPAPCCRGGQAWPHRCPKSRRVLRTHNASIMNLGRSGLFGAIVVCFVFRKFYNLLMKTQ